MDMEVYDCGKVVGTLHMEKIGLYQTVDCTCRPESGGILRLFVWDGVEGSCLGVLCPEGMEFTLRKRVSRAGLPFAPKQAVVGCEDEGFRPWRGEYDGVWVDDGYLKTGPAGETLAVPSGTEYPFAHPHRQLETRVICGRECVVLGEAVEETEKAPESEPQPEKEETPVQEAAPTKPEELPTEPEKARKKPEETHNDPFMEVPPEEISKPREEPQTRFHAEEQSL